MAKKKSGGHRTRPSPEENPQRPGYINIVSQYYWVFAGILLCMIAFFCFYQLGQLPARDWDEARHGVSAYEMLKNGNAVVNTYQYSSDYWNLKPPLSFWSVMAGYKLFGFNLFGMRFFSALSFLLTAVAVGLFSRWRYGAMESLTILLLFACSSPYYRFHFARHADADALFSFFAVISLLAMLLMDNYSWALPVCSGAAAFAFLTKSWHALFIVAVVGVVMIRRKLLFILSGKQWLAFLVAGAVPILAWAAWRYSYDGTQFFSEMLRVDLLNRTTTTLENHRGPITAYMQWSFQLSPLTGLLPICVGLFYVFVHLDSPKNLPSNPALDRDLPDILIWFCLPFILFSIVQTKLSWYLIPLNIPIQIATGLLLARLLQAPKREKVIRYGTLAAAALMIVPAGVQTWRDIQPPYHDNLQEFLHEDQELILETRGDTMYLALDLSAVPESGIQKYVLLGELYYDWNCKSGDISAFLADVEAATLLISESDYSANIQQLASCELIAQNNGYLVLKKQPA